MEKPAPNEESNDDIFLRNKKQSEKFVKLVVGVLIAFFLFTLYFLLSDT